MEKTVKPYNDQEGKKEQVSTMFDNIAKWYDFLNHFLSLGIDKNWRKQTIKALAPYNPQLVLDVATGTGDVAIEIAKRLSPKKITGIDISEKMLAVGREKIKKKGLEDLITLLSGDSEKILFDTESFDAVTVAFGVRNYENLEKGLQEMHRVLKKGGHLAILEFSKPKAFPLKQIYHFYFKNILPTFGKLFSKDPKAYSYLYESVMAFPDGKDFAELLEKNGFAKTKIKPMTFGICTLYFATK